MISHEFYKTLFHVTKVDNDLFVILYEDNDIKQLYMLYGQYGAQYGPKKDLIA